MTLEATAVQKASLKTAPNNIGTLNEGSLHESLKRLYAPPGAFLEVPVGQFVADIRTQDDRLIEIQTSGFGALRNKLELLLPNYPILLVYPIAQIRHIVKLADDQTTVLSSRRSPKKGKFSDVLDELTSIPKFLQHPNFSMDVALIEEQEFRVFCGQRHRRGWRVIGRRLDCVLDTWHIHAAQDLLGLIEQALPTEFTTAELAQSMGKHRSTGQKLAYCLHKAGLVEICAKQGNALVYRATDQWPNQGKHRARGQR
jgi:hypothetical protein